MKDLELKQTCYGLSYKVINHKLNCWTEYENTIADSQLEQYGFIIIDSFNTPIDNEFDIISIIDDINKKIEL